MEENNKQCSITEMPLEVITKILLNAEIEDIIAFGATCKYYNNILKNYEILWKVKFKNMVPPELFSMIENKNKDEIWFRQIKKYYKIKRKIYFEVIAMSPKYYLHNNTITINDLKKFFEIALSDNTTFYYTIFLLQDLLTMGTKKTAMWECRPPYTLTEMHYAKVVLSQLLHSYLSVKWAQKHVTVEMMPHEVLNLFIQWIDVVKIYKEDDVKNEINNLVCDVETLLMPDKPKTSVPGEVIKQQLTKNKLKERDVVAAVSQVLYNYRQIVVTSTMNIDTLNIIEVLKKKTGHFIAVAAMYHAVAEQCGLKCNVIAFRNHFFLEWICNDGNKRTQVQKINIESGEIQPNRRCPFSDQTTHRDSVDKSLSLLQYIITAYTNAVEPGHRGVNNWYRQNALLLSEMLNPESAIDCPYNDFFQYLTDDVPLKSMPPINMIYIHNELKQAILSLTFLNAPDDYGPVSRDAVVRKRNKHVQYAVGMICFHKNIFYTGIIVGWDLVCDANWREHPEVKNLLYGPNQPFYNVLAADESNRYVAQENLVFVTSPPRQSQLEDFIAREFTHFNGFAYIPNKEKRIEYPEDMQIIDMFLSRVENKMGVRSISAPSTTN